MKKLIFVCLALAAVFVGIWLYKVNAPEQNKGGSSDNQLYWWQTNPGEVPTADQDWVLPTDVNGDPIPDNYIPMINHKNLYMVIDEDGNIAAYRRATKSDDGTWYWETIEDPNIPENYIPVEGLEHVYQVTNADGSVQYFKYTRNEDNSFFFTEVDKDGNPLTNPLPNSYEAPENFVHIDDNIFGIYNEHGVLTGYAERITGEGDEFTWEFVDAPLDTELEVDPIPVVTTQPTTPGNNSGGDNGNGTTVNIITGKDPQGYYTETQTTTSIEHKDGWVYVYETILTLTYDKNGELYSTSKDGPNLINKYPETELNGGYEHGDETLPTEGPD